MQQFLGLCSYFRKFIYNFAKITCPLYEITKQKNEYVCNNEFKKSFYFAKAKLKEKTT